MSSIYCVKCHGLVEPRTEGSSQGPYCANCGFHVVTTYSIALDNATYTLRLSNGDPSNLRHIKAVSSIQEIGFLAARKMLGASLPEVFSGNALDVLKYKLRLQEAGLVCEIAPAFPYRDADFDMRYVVR